MIIDFHTHTFPDEIAEKSISYLVKKGGLQPYRDGTLGSLKESMRKSGVDYSLALPVATLPKQEKTINQLSVKLNGKDGVFFAGAIHPDCESVEDTLDFIKESGLFAVKLHPDYQGVDFDDPRYLKIMSEAAKRGLIIVTHAGVDVAFRDHIHCTPDMILRVLDKLGEAIENKLVLAHLGGYELPDESLEKLAGKPVYMDTAAVLKLYPEKCREIILRHGTDKILFATDSPWESQSDFIKIIKDFDLTQGQQDEIFYKNAQKLISSAKIN
ncbi:MAG: amidohydrolase [Ruminococcus sp.]|nr:amidohydrolase [Ruminococcus sp.]